MPTIRPAHPEDLPAIQALWEAFMLLLHQTHAGYYPVKLTEPAFQQQLLQQIMLPETCLLVAEEKEEIQGYLLAYITPMPPWFELEKIGLIRYLNISEHHRGKGLGQMLFDESMRWFREQQIERVELYVLQGLSASQFWEKQGFTPLMERRYLEV
ncbi:MAG: GNAT family N-acetyltransferase [Bacteroidota bacterium]